MSGNIPTVCCYPQAAQRDCPWDVARALAPLLDDERRRTDSAGTLDGSDPPPPPPAPPPAASPATPRALLDPWLFNDSDGRSPLLHVAARYGGSTSLGVAFGAALFPFLRGGVPGFSPAPDAAGAEEAAQASAAGGAAGGLRGVGVASQAAARSVGPAGDTELAAAAAAQRLLKEDVYDQLPLHRAAGARPSSPGAAVALLRLAASLAARCPGAVPEWAAAAAAAGAQAAAGAIAGRPG